MKNGRAILERLGYRPSRISPLFALIASLDKGDVIEFERWKIEKLDEDTFRIKFNEDYIKDLLSKIRFPSEVQDDGEGTDDTEEND